jgi:drug/metabolite transporter (DMT)-like permease
MIDALAKHNDVPRWRIVLGFLAIYLIWGSTYLAIRFTIESIPALISAGIRFLAGGGMLYVYARWRGAVPATKLQWRNAAVTGLLLVVGGTGTVTWAEQYVPSGLAALMIAAMPFWLVLIEWLRRDGVKPTPSVVMGLILGFIGIVILIGPIQLAAGGQMGLIGTMVLLLATLSWASGSSYSRHIDLPESKLLSVGIQMLAGGVVLVLLAGVSGEFPKVNFDAMTMKSIGGLLYLTFVGSIAFAAYVWLLKVASPAKVATYAFVNPVVAVFLGWLLGGEQLSSRTLLAAAVIVSAVAVITFYKNKKTAPSPVEVRNQPAVAVMPCAKEL